MIELVAADCGYGGFELKMRVFAFMVATGCASARGKVAPGCEFGVERVATGCEFEWGWRK